jgi:putative transposase
MYTVRRLKIGKSDFLDTLARECGRLYSDTLTAFWRVVRKKGVWLKPSSMMRWKNSDCLHAHTADACVQAFFASLRSWRVRRKTDPDAHPPRRRRWFFRIEYKSSAIRLIDGKLYLSNGRNMLPLVLDWCDWDCPKTVIIRWTGTQYEAVATYVVLEPQPVTQGGVVGVDLGEIHIAATSDGHIANGRYLRSLKQLRHKVQARIQASMDRRKKHSRRWRKERRAKAKFLCKIDHRIKDVLHKTTRRLVSTWQQSHVQTIVIGDVRDIRQDLDYGGKANQKIHGWSHGQVRWYLSYKAEREGMQVVLQEEAYTSQTCPCCQHRKKPKGRVYSCCKCGFVGHRDIVGAVNIRNKYLEAFGHPVDRLMAQARGFRYKPNLCCSKAALR